MKTLINEKRLREIQKYLTKVGFSNIEVPAYYDAGSIMTDPYFALEIDSNFYVFFEYLTQKNRFYAYLGLVTVYTDNVFVIDLGVKSIESVKVIINSFEISAKYNKIHVSNI